MNKLLAALSVCLMAGATCLAQKTTEPPLTMPYGKIDIADLELKACDFEKDANAMVLFDKGDVYFDNEVSVITMERHKRIKIFNDNGKSEANIRIEYYGGNRLETITGLQAETINLVNGKPEITKLDSKLLYTERVDKTTLAYVFSFPNVKPGSVIEYKYRWETVSISNMPDWYFQSKLPVRYSELTTGIPDLLYFRLQSRVMEGFTVDKTSSESKSIGMGPNMIGYTVEVKKRGLVNVHSLPDEPYMSSRTDNLQSLFFQLTYIKPISGFTRSFSDTWEKVGEILTEDEDFGAQLKRKLANEEAIVTKAKGMTTEHEKMAYIFKEVQAAMKWNGQDRWYTNDGTVKAWEKKTGNSAEVNIILYHLLKQAGVKAYPMVVSTREHGKVNPMLPFLYQFNRAVVYIPVDSTLHYVLDATGKYNSYNETPDNLLNSTGLYVDKDSHVYNTVFLTKQAPSMQTIMINADINPDGKMAGSAQMSVLNYNRINTIKKYKTDGEEKYIEYLRNSNNNLKISGLKFDNMEVDSLPLSENLNFKLDLTGSDGTYIYFSPAQFSPLRSNPFLSQNRMSDVDFGYRDNFSLLGTYKLPAGYKTDALPKSISLQMPDNSIIFRRVVAEQDGSVIVRYAIDYKKAIFFKEDYGQLFDFYKKLHELMNEQIVLKKS